MRGVQSMPYFECANDMGGGCALPSSGDADLPSGLSYATAAPCGLEARSVVAEELLGTGPGATPQSEGLVRARGRVRLRTPVPAPSGRSQPSIPAGGGLSAASRRRTVRSPTAPPSHWRVSCGRPGRSGTPSPSLESTAAYRRRSRRVLWRPRDMRPSRRTHRRGRVASPRSQSAVSANALDECLGR